MVLKKKCASFYEVLSDSQRESLIKEEIGTRKRTGIRHLTDETLKKLMLSIGQKGSSKNGQLIGDFSYDLLANRENAQLYKYITFGRPERKKFVTSQVGDEE